MQLNRNADDAAKSALQKEKIELMMGSGKDAEKFLSQRTQQKALAAPAAPAIV